MEEKRTFSFRFRFSLRTLLLVVTLLACLAGYLRWRHINSPEYLQRIRLAEFSQDFSAVPLQIGDWMGKNQPVNQVTIDAYGAWGAVRREYLNSKSGAKIELLVMRGKPGPISVHAPAYDYCRVRHSENSKSDLGLFPEVESVLIHKATVVSQDSYYQTHTWSPSGVWSAPSSPRFTFGDEPELSRITMVYTAADPQTWGNRQEFEDFFVEIFPHLQASLFPGK